jgi:hypothetical protein
MLEDLQRAEGVLKHLQGLMVGDWFAHDTPKEDSPDVI